jgi:hypothetical protein
MVRVAWNETIEGGVDASRKVVPLADFQFLVVSVSIREGGGFIDNGCVRRWNQISYISQGSNLEAGAVKLRWAASEERKVHEDSCFT